jgi:outer membrane protein OmpA-like peptidoglycan-associated protein
LGRTPVRWIRLRLQGGIDQGRGPFFQEFTEIIGNGTQETVPLAGTFHGIWKQGANVLELQQDGAVVEGCYDVNGELHGTVTGNVLRATGVSRDTGVRSAFVLTVDRDGGVHGVRSANGAPFRDYDLPIAPKGTRTPCSEKKPAALGCGSIVHGIGFDFDSAAIRSESEPVLVSLFAGLQTATAATIVVEGHTSSEGSDSYNQELSTRRASAVVTDLVRRGLAAERIRAVGRGESKPIADNRDEAGRALNRRVEIVCTTGGG